MKKILFIPGQGLAHITRTLLVAKTCQEKYVVEILLSKKFLYLGKKAGVKTKQVDIPHIDYKKIISGDYRKIGNRLRMIKDVRIYERALLEFSPDLAITSSAMNAVIPIRKHSIKHVAITDSSSINGSKYGTDLDNPGVKTFEKIVLTQFNRVARDYGIPAVENFMGLVSNDLNLIPDLPSLFPLKEQLKKFKFIGPISWHDENTSLEKDITIDPAKPLVYVSMGSSGKGYDLEKIAKLLSPSPYQVIITTGGVISPSRIKKYERPGFYIRPFVAGDHIIKASKKTIVICHAGLGTVYQALMNGAYGIITVPAHAKHSIISKRLENSGVAEGFNINSTDNILSLCAKVLSTPQAAIYKKIKSELKTYKGTQNARAAIDRLLG